MSRALVISTKHKFLARHSSCILRSLHYVRYVLGFKKSYWEKVGPWWRHIWNCCRNHKKTGCKPTHLQNVTDCEGNGHKVIYAYILPSSQQTNTQQWNPHVHFWKYLINTSTFHDDQLWLGMFKNTETTHRLWLFEPNAVPRNHFKGGGWANRTSGDSESAKGLAWRRLGPVLGWEVPFLRCC